MKTEENKRKEEGPKKESPCMAFCGTLTTDEMMAKCCESMGGVGTQGMAEMMAKGCEGMNEGADWSKIMKTMCSKSTKRAKTQK
jgi:hypothetical protein